MKISLAVKVCHVLVRSYLKCSFPCNDGESSFFLAVQRNLTMDLYILISPRMDVKTTVRDAMGLYDVSVDTYSASDAILTRSFE